MTTKRQQQVIDYIRDREAAGGASPSYEEIALAVGLSAKSGVHRIVSGLIRHGHLSGDLDENGVLRARSLRLPASIQKPPVDQIERLVAGLREVAAINDEIERKARAAGIIAALRAA